MIWVALVIAVVLLAVLPRIRTIVGGSRLTSELVTGNFGSSEVSKQLAAFFREIPSRNVQREQFVQLGAAMGCPTGLIAEHVLRSVMRAWKEPGMPFGSSLAQEVDELIVFDKPSTPDQELKQRDAQLKLDDFKSQLRALDAEIS